MKAIYLNQLSKSLNYLSSTQLPVATMFKVLRLKRVIDTEAETYNAAMTNLLRAYASFDENGNLEYLNEGQSIKIKPEFVEECNTEYAKLNDVEVSVPSTSFNLEEFKGIELSGDLLEPLIDFIEA